MTAQQASKQLSAIARELRSDWEFHASKGGTSTERFKVADEHAKRANQPIMAAAKAGGFAGDVDLRRLLSKQPGGREKAVIHSVMADWMPTHCPIKSMGRTGWGWHLANTLDVIAAHVCPSQKDESGQDEFYPSSHFVDLGIPDNRLRQAARRNQIGREKRPGSRCNFYRLRDVQKLCPHRFDTK